MSERNDSTDALYCPIEIAPSQQTSYHRCTVADRFYMRTFLYARTAAAGPSTTEQLRQAAIAGFTVDALIVDGRSSVDQGDHGNLPLRRPVFADLRRGDVLVVRWLDQLARSPIDVCDALRELMAHGIIVKTIVETVTFDGSATDPKDISVRDAILAFMAASAKAQSVAVNEIQRAGILRAKSAGAKYLGRKPSYDRAQYDAVLVGLSAGKGASLIARETGISRQAVYRIEAAPEAANEALVAWGL